MIYFNISLNIKHIINTLFKEKNILYGNGLSSLFMYSNLISIITDDHFLIFDPIEEELNGNGTKIYQYTKNKLYHRFSDQFIPFIQMNNINFDTTIPF